ncbi:hypothetical protein B0H66DRAFT_644321 [Apodospora peruviana]|uniref:Uncharacterized protein n=1 Tax=Apodospora peruviana TaxID=516989 RepID=A0AAE0HUN8_9PEZI|nr:hypothetical protein B0H66DRAFT_644321 [Apodospora peruviana]
MAAVDNLIRGVLVALTAISYYPQLHRVVTRRNATGISLVYLFLSAASAIEQFTIYAAHFEFNHLYPDTVVPTPPDLGAYLNLAQVLVYLVFSSALLLVCLIYPSGTRTFGEKCFVVVAYIVFALFTLLQIALWTSKHVREHDWYPSMFISWHCLYVNWFVTAGVFPVSLLFQLLAMRDQPVPRALSISGLAVQAVVFTLVGISWLYRMSIDVSSWIEWYEYVGHCAINCLLFALAQLILLIYTLGRSRAERRTHGAAGLDETSPLLAN